MKNQNIIETEKYGTIKFVPTPHSGLFTDCCKCVFMTDTNGCKTAPCIGCKRDDGKHGYFVKLAKVEQLSLSL